jgi:hypothetical protein
MALTDAVRIRWLDLDPRYLDRSTQSLCSDSPTFYLLLQFMSCM